MVLAEASAAGQTGIGVTHGSEAAASVVTDLLADQVVGQDALDVGACWDAMVKAVRNAGRPGIAGTAISATDLALWDLEAKLHGVPLCRLLRAVARASPCTAAARSPPTTTTSCAASSPTGCTSSASRA